MKNLNQFIIEKLKGSTLKTYENDEYVDLDLPSKTLWGKYNVGATHKSTPESYYGDYFMWGDTNKNNMCDLDTYKHCINGKFNQIIKYCTTKKEKWWKGRGRSDNKLVLDDIDDVCNVNIGNSCYMPTKELYEELIENTTYKWVTNYDGIRKLNGILFTSKNNDNDLFFPACGYKIYSRSIFNVNDCCYWSAGLDDTTPSSAYCLHYYNSTNKLFVNTSDRSKGFNVRGVMNS